MHSCVKHHTFQMLIVLTEACGHGGRCSAKGSLRPLKGHEAAAGDVCSAANAGFFGVGAVPVRAAEFKAGQDRKRKRRKRNEVHLKFYTLMFIYVVFLEGAAWAADGVKVLQKSHQKPKGSYAIPLRDQQTGQGHHL